MFESLHATTLSQQSVDCVIHRILQHIKEPSRLNMPAEQFVLHHYTPDLGERPFCLPLPAAVAEALQAYP